MSQFISGQVLTAALLNASLTAARGGNWLSAKEFGAVGDGLTDDTAALQAAINAAISQGRMLLIPDGTYKITATLQVGTNPQASLTGLRIVGQSRLNTVISQSATNTPIFTITGLYIHTLEWAHMTLTYAAMQTGQTNACVFKTVGPSDGSIYNCLFQDIAGSNFYWFNYCDGASLTWWGMTYRDMWLGDFAGGINFIDRSAGEPNNRFERMYISCQSAVETLFHHEAMTAQYESIEVNSANGSIGMLYDDAGGTHIIGHWALEVANYTKDTTLFNVINGVLLARYIYTETLNIAAGVNVWTFHCEGARSFIHVEYYGINGIGAINGTLFAANAPGPLPVRFKRIVLPWAANVQLCDIGGSESAEHVIVEDWNDPTTTVINGDNDVTLHFDSSVQQIFDTPLTAPRTVTLPQGTPDPTSVIFTGRRFRVVKSNTSAFALTIKDFGGNTVATIAAGTRAVVDLVWHRGGGANGFSWVITDQHTY